MSYRAISRKLGCSKSSVWYHAKKRGTVQELVRYDWDHIGVYVQAGRTLPQAMIEFGFARSTWEAAVRRGAVQPVRRKLLCDLPASEILCKNSRFDRRSVRRYVLELDLLPYMCALCDVDSEWQGQPLTLILDHVDGDNGDHRLKNLRFLCPNCDIQQPTYGSKNRGRVPNTNRNKYRRAYERANYHPALG